jgi:hypothetical protein
VSPLREELPLELVPRRSTAAPQPSPGPAPEDPRGPRPARGRSLTRC